MLTPSFITHETHAAWLDKGRLRHASTAPVSLGLGRALRRFLDEKGVGK